jgi:redox-sensitive bicupin YhaK (pirin superfamily)
MTKIRQLAGVINGQATSDGAGVKLKRIISPSPKNTFDPFLLLDEFASENADDYIAGFPPHPHRGFETVTYMLNGAMLHRDHLGNEGHLRAGDVQWMTAAHGIIHSEMPEQTDGLLHGFQLWLNLPASEKMKPPHYRDIAAAEIPRLELGDGSYLKLIAGDYACEQSTLSGAVQGISTQPLYFDVVLNGQHTLTLPINPQHTVVVYVYDGALTVDNQHGMLNKGQLGHLVQGDTLQLSSAQSARFLLLAACR